MVDGFRPSRKIQHPGSARATAARRTQSPIDLSQLPAIARTLTSEALAANNSGTAVGAAVLNAGFNAHAVLWANGKAADLGFGVGGDAGATGSTAAA